MILNTQKYCNSLLKSEPCIKYPFHNLIHTHEVVANVRHISTQLKLTNREQLILEIAAWFHDTGFSKTYEGHEDVSKELAWEYLTTQDVDKQILQDVLGCIEATKMPQNPQNKLEKLCAMRIYIISPLLNSSTKNCY